MRVALFDYGAGNLHSLAKALESGGSQVTITRDWPQALALDALVLPGVGAFGAAVRSIGNKEKLIRGALEDGYPCLGICLGMQLLLEDSEEGEGRGIGLFPGSVQRLRGKIVPQMGWNDVQVNSDPIFSGIEALVAYYANSFVCEPSEAEQVIATSEYEGEIFPAGIRKGNTWGVQFHPEKSSGPGLQLIRNFLEAVR